MKTKSLVIALSLIFAGLSVSPAHAKRVPRVGDAPLCVVDMLFTQAVCIYYDVDSCFEAADEEGGICEFR